MRLISVVGLLVMALGAGLFAGACQVRNAQRCQLPDFPCERGILCKLDPGSQVGTCVEECNKATAGTMTTCPDERPICGDDGTCRTCLGDGECQGRNTSLPRCVAQKCVACRANSDCSDPLKPVCDMTSNTCRGCTLHSECADSVCVKDDTLSGLTDQPPLKQGQCVPAARQVLVDRNCSGTCNMQSKLQELTTEKPYLRVSGYHNTTLLTINKPTNSLPVIHIVTDTADLSPLQLTAPPGSDMSNGAGAGIQVNGGTDVVLEGLTLFNTKMGLVCAGTMGSPTATKVRVIRSLFASNDVGISSRSCDLRIEDSWLGIGPPAYGALALSGNLLAMDLDTTRFEITNTSFVRNAPRMPGGGFAGVTVRNTLGAPQPGRIVHATFMRHDTPAISKATAVDCLYAVGSTLTVLNSLFVNDVSLGTNTYLAPNCKTGNGDVLSNGSDDPTLSGTGSVTDLKYTDLFVGTGLSGASYSPRIKPTAASLVRHGTAAYSDSQGTLVLPTVDSEGRPRPASNVAFGAFEPAQ
jgi:hypothetical protein